VPKSRPATADREAGLCTLSYVIDGEAVPCSDGAVAVFRSGVSIGEMGAGLSLRAGVRALASADVFGSLVRFLYRESSSAVRTR
jgi:hypothetical protein